MRTWENGPVVMITDRKWSLLCWATASFLGLGWVILLVFHPDPRLIFQLGGGDVLIYRILIQRAAAGFGLGDPFLWEHHADPGSIFSIFHFWPTVLGGIFRSTGCLGLLATSLLLSGLWFHSVFRFCLRLGQGRPYAFFVAGVQTFFVINQAYEICGFKTNLAAYSFFWTEHERLYPTVTSMAFYNLAALVVLWALDRRSIVRGLLAGGLVALTAYGRGYEWMVLLGALVLFGGTAYFRGERRNAGGALIVTILSLLFSLRFICQFMGYQKAHYAVFLEQIARGGLQVKLPEHYVKYAVLCAVLLAILAVAFRKLSPIAPGVTAGDALQKPRTALLWLCALAASSLLAHFKTALDGGVTMAGFTYLVVFSVAPWFFMLAAHAGWEGFFRHHPRLASSHGWPVILMGLLTIQQVGYAWKQEPSSIEFQRRCDRQEAYHRILEGGRSQPVVLTLGNGLEVSSRADAWLFFANPAGVAGLSPARTTELLDRVLLAKALMTGTIEDLRPLFAPDGLLEARAWLSQQDSRLQFWARLLEHGIGANTFILWPTRNRGELRLRKIELPGRLRDRDQFVAYFTPELQQEFEESTGATQARPAAEILKRIQARYRLDYIYVPSEEASFCDLTRLEKCPFLEEIPLSRPTSGRLWKVRGSGEPR